MTNVQAYSLLTDFDISLFSAGKHFRIYEKLGSRPIEIDGKWGTYFAVWAPDARSVAVKGNFNNWKPRTHPLNARRDGSGIWEGWIEGIGKGTLYKYHLVSYDGRQLERGDPYARYWEAPPNTASIVWDTYYEWQDGDWMKKRGSRQTPESPFSVYEVHLGSWKKASADKSPGYRDLADELVAYVTQMGFAHVQFLPVMEHPYFPSWGYQVTGYFAPSARFGQPEGLMYLIDRLHQANIGVLLDWVPSHYPHDAHGLYNFDGTHLYEHADPRKGYHPDWKSAIFNYGRNEVRSFLISNALFWLDQYHADGLRVDAVASMLYLDYSREEGQWEPNHHGGNENLEAISFLKEFNETVHREYPDCVTIAEESTAFAGVSKPVNEGGLGFDQKWMMGWMHDTLEYFKLDPIHRKFNHHKITFSMVYAYSERFMLPLSHDEVVHGKGTLLTRMPGSEWMRFANLRMLYAYMFTHPGTQLLFMGGEFGQTTEWNIERGLDWSLTEYAFHRGIQTVLQDLNALYTSRKALHETQFLPEGFEWIEVNDGDHSVLVYQRLAKDRKKPLVVICNFTPVKREAYRVGLPVAGTYNLVLNTDSEKYHGPNEAVEATYKSTDTAWHYKEQSVLMALPALSVLVLELKKKAPAKRKKASNKKVEQSGGKKK